MKRVIPRVPVVTSGQYLKSRGTNILTCSQNLVKIADRERRIFYAARSRVRVDMK